MGGTSATQLFLLFFAPTEIYFVTDSKYHYTKKSFFTPNSTIKILMHVMDNGWKRIKLFSYLPTCWVLQNYLISKRGEERASHLTCAKGKWLWSCCVLPEYLNGIGVSHCFCFLPQVPRFLWNCNLPWNDSKLRYHLGKHPTRNMIKRQSLKKYIVLVVYSYCKIWSNRISIPLGSNFANASLYTTSFCYLDLNLALPMTSPMSMK